jgi:hypothetical protein
MSPTMFCIEYASCVDGPMSAHSRAMSWRDRANPSAANAGN